MQPAITLGMAAVLVLGIAALAAPTVSANTTCGDVGCCQAFEKGKVFVRCVVCVAPGNDWDVDADECVIY